MTAAQYIGNQQFKLIDGKTIEPASDEVRLEVGYVGICGTDMHIYHGVMDKRVAPPQIIGHEMSGVVAEIGSAVEDFEIGDRVVVRPLDYCGACPACDAGLSHICQNLKFMGIDSPGAMQQSWTVKARTLHRLPQNVSLKLGALIEPLSVACHDVERASLKRGEKAVVLGGGPIGQLIALVAKSIGADVLVSEVSKVRRQFATDQGVRSVDPTAVDLAEEVRAWTDGKGADVVFEVSGVAAVAEAMTEIAAARGRICMVAIHANPPKVNLFQFFWKELEMVGARVYQAADFERAIQMVANGEIDLEPFVTSINSLPDIGVAFAGMDGNPAGMPALLSCGKTKIN